MAESSKNMDITDQFGATGIEESNTNRATRNRDLGTRPKTIAPNKGRNHSVTSEPNSPVLNWFVKNTSGPRPSEDKKSPLLSACEQGDVRRLQVLVEDGLGVYSDKEKEHCLTEAFCRGHVECVRLLVQFIDKFPNDLKWKVLRKKAIRVTPEEQKRDKGAIFDECIEIINRSKKEKATQGSRNRNEIDQQTGSRSREITQPTGSRSQEITQPPGSRSHEIEQQTGSRSNEIEQATGSSSNEIEQPTGSRLLEITQPTGSRSQEITQPSGSRLNEVEQPTGSRSNQIEQPTGSWAREITQPTGSCASAEPASVPVFEPPVTQDLEHLLREIVDVERGWDTPFGYVIDEPNIWSIFDNIMCPFFELMNKSGQKVLLRRQALDEWEPLPQNKQSASKIDSVVISVIYAPRSSDCDHMVVAVIEPTTHDVYKGVIYDNKESSEDERNYDEMNIFTQIDSILKDLEIRLKDFNWRVLKPIFEEDGYCAVYALITILLKYFVRIEEPEQREILEKYTRLSDALVTACLFEMLHYMAAHITRGETFRFERVQLHFIDILKAAHRSLPPEGAEGPAQ